MTAWQRTQRRSTPRRLREPAPLAEHRNRLYNANITSLLDLQMFTYRTVVLLPLIITATLSPKLAIATVASNERCEGLAIVWPPSKDPGSVYLGPTLVSSELWRNKKERTKSSYPRMGYLP